MKIDKGSVLASLAIAVIVIPFGLAMCFPPSITNEEVIHLVNQCKKGGLNAEVRYNTLKEPRRVNCVPVNQGAQ